MIMCILFFFFFFFQAEDGIRDAQESRGLGDVYKRQVSTQSTGDHFDSYMAGGGGNGGQQVQLQAQTNTKCSQTPEQCSVVINVAGIRGDVLTKLDDDRKQAQVEFQARVKGGSRRHVLQLKFSAPVDPGPRVEINPKNGIVHFRKAVRETWDVLPNKMPTDGGSKKSRKKSNKQNALSKQKLCEEGSSSELAVEPPEPVPLPTPSRSRPTDGPFGDDDVGNDLYNSLVEENTGDAGSLLDLDDEEPEEQSMMPLTTPNRSRTPDFSVAEEEEELDEIKFGSLDLGDDDCDEDFDEEDHFGEADELVISAKPGSPRAQQLKQELQEAMAAAKKQQEVKSRTSVQYGWGSGPSSPSPPADRWLHISKQGSWDEIGREIQNKFRSGQTGLDLAGCGLAGAGLEGLEALLLCDELYRAVLAIDLSFCSLSGPMMRPTWLGGANVREIVLSGNDLEDTGVMALSAAMRSAEWEVLDLSNCGITAEGADSLLDAAMHSCLRSIFLDDNPIGDDGAKHLANMLSSADCRLERIGAANCRIGDDGIRVLCTALALTQAPLSLLDMSSNHDVTPEGKAVLEGIKMIKKNIALSSPPACCAGERTKRKWPKAAGDSHMLPSSAWPVWDEHHPLLLPKQPEGTFDLTPSEIDLVNHADSGTDVSGLIQSGIMVAEMRLELRELSDLWTPIHPVAAALGSAAAHAVNLIAAGPKLQGFSSTYGAVQQRCGLARMAALDLLVSVAAVNSPYLDSVLAATQAPAHAMRLLYWNNWCNPVHVAVQKIMVCSLSSDCDDLVDQALLPVIRESISRAHEVLSSSGKPLDSVCGFTSHLVSITQAIVATQQRLRVYNADPSDGFHEFVQESLPDLARVLEDQTPCGGAPQGLPPRSFMEWASGLS
eukprot:TRINITY_DN1137_c0_g1_i20.p1 TRINITY_DN1137_c0_g1~~TRINITY_DN1137_c0_g1_i20.p1  ORF type:complete len:888 (+),score=223.07 TRINITY_DN1137_c0_g1_i20:90-2753(+)